MNELKSKGKGLSLLNIRNLITVFTVVNYNKAQAASFGFEMQLHQI